MPRAHSQGLLGQLNAESARAESAEAEQKRLRRALLDTEVELQRLSTSAEESQAAHSVAVADAQVLPLLTTNLIRNTEL